VSKHHGVTGPELRHGGEGALGEVEVARGVGEADAVEHVKERPLDHVVRDVVEPQVRCPTAELHGDGVRDDGWQAALVLV
jgi:hypothetical protein